MTTPAHLYILRLRSGGLYIGVTRDLARRLAEHRTAHGCGRTTRRDPPVALVYTERHASIRSALIRERQLKRWRRAKKQALIAGDARALKRLSSARRRRDG